MNTSNPKEFRHLTSCCTGASRSSLQLDKSKENSDFFQDFSQVLNQIENGTKNTDIALCPVAIRMENKYKCCKARIVNVQERLAKLKEENEILKKKLNEIELLSGNKYSELIAISAEAEIQKWERFKAETKLQQMVTHVKSVNKVIACILTGTECGNIPSLLMPPTRVEIEGSEMTKKICERESVSSFAELRIHVNIWLENYQGMQMKTRSEMRALIENLKKVEGLLQSKSLNAKELPYTEVIPSKKLAILNNCASENCSKVSSMKSVPMLSLQMQSFAEGNVEMPRNENNEQHNQGTDSYPNKSGTSPTHQSDNVETDMCSSDEASSTDGTCSTQINQQLALSNLHPNNLLYDLIQMEIEEKRKKEAEAGFHLRDGNKSDNGKELPQVDVIPPEKFTTLKGLHLENCSKVSIMKVPIPSTLVEGFVDENIEISKHINNEENSQDKNPYPVSTSEQTVDKGCAHGQSHNSKENGSSSHHDMEENTQAIFSKEVQQQLALISDLSQDKQVQDFISVTKPHYQIQAEGDMDRNKFHCKCGKNYVVKAILDIHILKGNDPQRMKFFQCNICDMRLKTQQNLNVHKQRTHEEIRFPCHLCNKTLSSKRNLQNHLKTHMGQCNYKCDVCNKSFVRKNNLISHKICHSDKKHKCWICVRKFLQKCSLKTHMRSHTKEKPSYKCNTCEKCFATTSSLNFHQIKHSGETLHKCPDPVCSASFRRKQDLKVHQRTHFNRRLYSCSQCPRAYAQRFNLRIHLLTHNSPIRVPAFHCVFCEKAFLSRNGLDYHIRAHVGESRVFCEYCDKGFLSVGWKDEHVRYMHSEAT